MRIAHFALAALAALAITACSSPGSTATRSPAAVPPSSPAAATASPVAASPAASAITRIEVTLTDSMAIELSSMTVPAGVPITFVVTNTGVADHEFYLGDESAQVAHEAEMMANGGMSHDEPGGVAVAPGETKELVHTFGAAGVTIAGCHVAGHYAAGMMTQITIAG